jgi:hypothetical protein
MCADDSGVADAGTDQHAPTPGDVQPSGVTIISSGRG